MKILHMTKLYITCIDCFIANVLFIDNLRWGNAIPEFDFGFGRVEKGLIFRYASQHVKHHSRRMHSSLWTSFGEMSSKALSNTSIIQGCAGLIKSFNPVTHSIDTHCSDFLGDCTSPVSLCNLGFVPGIRDFIINIYVLECQCRGCLNAADCLWMVQRKAHPEGSF